MKIIAALPIAAALALTACSGGSGTENVTLSNDSAGLEENVATDDLAFNDSGVLNAGDTTEGNLGEAANTGDALANDTATNAL